MKAFKILLIFCFAFFSGFMHAGNGQLGSTEKILVLVSYHMTHPWADTFVKSMIDNAKDWPNHPDFIVVELNSMRVPDPKAWDQVIRLQLANVQAGKYKMIVAVNDTALQCILKYSKDLPPDLPIVFAGCEMYTPTMQKLHPNMTGIIQNTDTRGTIKVALQLYPKTKRIAILYDSSDASICFIEKLKQSLPVIPGVEYIYINDGGVNNSLNASFQRIAELPEDSLVLVSSWRGLYHRDYQSINSFAVFLAQTSKLPYFVSTDAMIGHGALGGYVSSASDFGMETARMIHEVFRQGSAIDIPPVAGYSRPVFDYKIMSDNNLNFSKLPADSHFVNSPVGLWHRHPAIITGMGIFLLLLMILSGGMVLYLVAVRKTMKRSRELYCALPGRIGVLNRQEKILYLNSRIYQDNQTVAVKYFKDIPEIDYPKLSAAIADVFASKRTVTLEYEYHQVKRIMTIASLASHLFGEESVVWFSHDNAELQEVRQQAEEYAVRLKKTTRMWNILINSLPIHIFAKDAENDFRYIFNNKTRAQFLGIASEDLDGKNDFEIFPSEIATELRRQDEADMSDIERSKENVIDLDDHNGKTHRMHTVQTPFIDEDGTCLLLGAMIDITEQEESRRFLEEEHELREEMIEFIPFIFFVKDVDQNFRYVMGNQAFEKFVGAQPGTLKGKTSAEALIASPEVMQMSVRDQAVIQSDHCLEFQEKLISADGQLHHMLTYKKFFQGRSGRRLLLGASFDITELHNAVSEARKSNEELQDVLSLYNILLDNMNAYVFTKDIDREFRFTSCNQFCCQLLGSSKDEIIGKSDAELFHDKEEAAAFLAADKEGAEKGETECIQEYTGTNGVKRIGKFWRKRIQLSRNRNWLFLLVVDITEQEEVKRRAEENAEWLRLTLNSIGDGVIATDAAGNIVMLNPVAEHMIGVKEKEVLGIPHDRIFKIVGTYDEQPMPSPLWQALQTGAVIELTNHSDLLACDGRRYHVADSAAPICDDAHHVIGAILVFRDVTKEYESRDQLRRAVTSLEYASELTNSAAFVYDTTTGVMTGSKYLNKLWPINENNIAASIDKWVYPDDREKMSTIWDSSRARERAAAVFDYRAIKEGAVHYYRLKSAADCSKPGTLRFIGVIQDITEITAGAMKLHDTIALWEQVINTIPIMFFVKDVDDDFRYLLCNRAFAEFHGLKQEDVFGKSDENIVEGATEWIMADDHAVVASSEVCNFERNMIDCNGITHPLKIVKKIFVEANGRRLLIGASSDISELDNVIQNEKAVKESLSGVMLENSLTGAFERIALTLNSRLGCDRVLLTQCNKDGMLRFFNEWHSPDIVDLKTTMLEHHYAVWDIYVERLRMGELVKFNDFNGSEIPDTYKLNGNGYILPSLFQINCGARCLSHLPKKNVYSAFLMNS